MLRENDCFFMIERRNMISFILNQKLIAYPRSLQDHLGTAILKTAEGLGTRLIYMIPCFSIDLIYIYVFKNSS